MHEWNDYFPFQKNYRRKLKQANNKSKSTLLICLSASLGELYESISKKIQNFLCHSITVLKISKSALLALLELSIVFGSFGAGYLSSAKTLVQYRVKYHKTMTITFGLPEKIPDGALKVFLKVFSTKFSSPKVPKYSVRDLFCASESFCYQKNLCMRGVSLKFVEISQKVFIGVCE